MSKEIIQKHKDMVLRLAKPGEKILASLTPWDCDLTHMAGCLPGEASELYDAILADLSQSSAANAGELTEELGDYAFYLVKCSAIFGREWHGRVHHASAPVANCIELMRLGGHFWDVAKRATIYRKPIDVPDSKYDQKTLTAVGVEYLDQMEERFNAIFTYYNMTLDEVLEGNYTKLADVDKGRFSSGSYSDQQAQDRKDKQ